jgi:hypothetical protein
MYKGRSRAECGRKMRSSIFTLPLGKDLNMSMYIILFSACSEADLMLNAQSRRVTPNLLTVSQTHTYSEYLTSSPTKSLSTSPALFQTFFTFLSRALLE